MEDEEVDKPNISRRVQEDVRRFLEKLPSGGNNHDGQNTYRRQTTWEAWSASLPSKEHVANLKERFTRPREEAIQNVPEYEGFGENAAQKAQQEARGVLGIFDEFLKDALTQNTMPQENVVCFLKFHLLAGMCFLRARCQRQLGINRRERQNPFRDQVYNNLLSEIRNGVRRFYKNSGSPAKLANDVDVDHLFDAAEFGCQLLSILSMRLGPRINEIPINNKTFLSLLQMRSKEAKKYIISELTRELMQKSNEAGLHWHSRDSTIISPVNMIIANLNHGLDPVDVFELIIIPEADVSAPFLLPMSTFDT